MADKVSLPVLLLSGKIVNKGSYRHSRKMKAALKNANKQVELVEYFEPSYRYRVKQGLLTLDTELDEFLKMQLRPKKVKTKLKGGKAV
jgi:hypothetical protein